MQILHTVQFLFPLVLTRRICLTNRSFSNWWSFPLFSWPVQLILRWYRRERSDPTHSLEFNGLLLKWTDLHVIWSWLHRPKLEHFAIEFYLIFLSLHCFSNRMAMYQPVKWCLKCATVTTLSMEKTSQDGHPFTYQLRQDSTMSLLNWLLSHLQILKPWIMMAGNKSQSDNTCRW